MCQFKMHYDVLLHFSAIFKDAAVRAAVLELSAICTHGSYSASTRLQETRNKDDFSHQHRPNPPTPTTTTHSNTKRSFGSNTCTENVAMSNNSNNFVSRVGFECNERALTHTFAVLKSTPAGC